VQVESTNSYLTMTCGEPPPFLVKDRAKAPGPRVISAPEGRRSIARGESPWTPSPPQPPSPGRGDSDHRRLSVPEIALVVRDPVPLQEREELLLEGHPPMMLSLPGQVRLDPIEVRRAHRECAVAGLPGEPGQGGEGFRNPPRRIRLDD